MGDFLGLCTNFTVGSSIIIKFYYCWEEYFPSLRGVLFRCGEKVRRSNPRLGNHLRNDDLI